MATIMLNHAKLAVMTGWQLTLNIRAEAAQSENSGDSVWNARD